MKAEFIAVAVLFLVAGVYAVYATQDMRRRHRSDFTLTVSSDGDYEQIKHSGQLRINADETAIDSISPGGYFSYEHNERKIKITCDSPGVLRTAWVGNGQQRVFDSAGKKIMQEAIRELIVYGYDAEARASRICQRGGAQAVLIEADQMKADNVKRIYLAAAKTTNH